MTLPKQEHCREWVEHKYDRCNAQAVVILWGKLFPAEALGPRCNFHAVPHFMGRSVTEIITAGWAVYDLRQINSINELKRG